MPKQLTQAFVIATCRKVHNNKYDYSRVIYKNKASYSEIKCPEHGWYRLNVYNHMQGGVCPKCKVRNRWDTKETFIDKAQNVHGKKFDYSKVIYKTSKTKVKIICPEHGVFMQEPRIHLSGKGCLECGLAGRRKNLQEQMETWGCNKPKRIYKGQIQFQCKVHGWQPKENHNKRCILCLEELYKRREVKVNNEQLLIQKLTKRLESKGYIVDIQRACVTNGVPSITAGTVSCKVHGVLKLCTPYMIKHSCKLCGIDRRKQDRENDVRAFKDALKSINIPHCKVLKPTRSTIWKNGKLSGTVIVECNKHGVSVVDVNAKSCPYCLREKPGFTYKYVNGKALVYCDKHGKLNTKLLWHLNVYKESGGCRACIKENAIKRLTHTTQMWIEKAQAVHGDRYDYSVSEYKGKSQPIQISCRKHGVFEINCAGSHIHKQMRQGCPRCNKRQGSRPERQVCTYLRKVLKLDIIRNNRTLLNRKELDIYIPSHSLAIEVNGIYWHSDVFKTERDYHKEKYKACTELGIKLLQFTDVEIQTKADICKSIISSHIGLNSRWYARQLVVKSVKPHDANVFFETNHLQGHAKAHTYIGLFNGTELLACMSFGKPRFNTGYDFEIVRFANKKFTTVVGGAGRLLSHFSKQHSGKSLLSYADCRISNGNVYEQLGFSKVRHTTPNYMYVKSGSYLTRYQTQKHKLRTILEKFNPLLTEYENMYENGYNRLYDAGHLVYVKTM